MNTFDFKGLKIEKKVNLGNLTTMKLGGEAKFLTRISSVDQAFIALEFARKNRLEIFVLGGGSNTLVHDEGFSGLVVKNEILGRDILAKNPSGAVMKIGAGENWDEFVRWAVVEKQLAGCEMMVMIPGLVGALPVQNVGAYGQETKDIFVELEALNLQTGKLEILRTEDCKFGYRDSIFRSSAEGRYLILTVSLKLHRRQPVPPFYISVEEYLDRNNISRDDISARQLMEIVINIRSTKLPDPAEIPSAGSFFKNSVISAEKAAELKATYGENIPIFPFEDKFKVATGWLIDQAGLRGKTICGMRLHPGNALILTNISAKSFGDLAQARAEIQAVVEQKFGIKIEQEPLEI